MPKGNHVFNNFDGTIHNAFTLVLEALKNDDALRAVNGNGGDATEGAQRLNKKYPNSYRFYGEIMNHPSVALLHNTQDDEEVLSNDPNSIAFGKHASEFCKAAVNWVWDVGVANPMDPWRQMVNVGFDKDAFTNYVKKGSSAAGTPNNEAARKRRCHELHQFVKGDLTKLAVNWLLGLRLDLKIAKAVTYEKKPREWKQLLEMAAANIS